MSQLLIYLEGFFSLPPPEKKTNISCQFHCSFSNETFTNGKLELSHCIAVPQVRVLKGSQVGLSNCSCGASVYTGVFTLIRAVGEKRCSRKRHLHLNMDAMLAV